MPRFFIEGEIGESFVLDGENGRHGVKSLRLRPGERVALCDGKGFDYVCRVTGVSGETLLLETEEKRPSVGEPSLRVTLYQGLPKGDKMDLIIQKAVELGCSQVVPVETEFCIAKLNGREEKKLERWRKIALEAAKQSGRGMVPQVLPPLKFSEAAEQCGDGGILFYEGGGRPVRELVKGRGGLSVFVGPEGGFSPKEIALAKEKGLSVATLGPRILRTETAPLAALAVLMYESGNLE